MSELGALEEESLFVGGVETKEVATNAIGTGLTRGEECVLPETAEEPGDGEM